MRRKRVVAAAVAFLAYLLLVPALLFGVAGIVAWAAAWVCAGLHLSAAVVSRLSPGTLRERAQFLSSEGVKPWDRALVLVIGAAGSAAMAIAAGPDHRSGWSPSVPAVVQWFAGIGVAAGYALGVSAIIANCYFSAAVQLQPDRGQTVVAVGPYRFVRHPSYAGPSLTSLVQPVMLGALWALIPAVVIVVATLARTALEDQLLLAGLPDHRHYAAQTRYRLLPGVW